MSLHHTKSERILRDRLGAPINPVQDGRRAGQDNDKVLGFSTADGKILALDRKIQHSTHIWTEPFYPRLSTACRGVVRLSMPT